MFRHGVARYSSIGKNRISTLSNVQPVLRLSVTDSSAFKLNEDGFDEPFENPLLLPKGYYADLPACTRWFQHSRPEPTLNANHFAIHGHVSVPIELYQPALDGRPALFQRTSVDLTTCIKMLSSYGTPSSPTIYLAQCPLADLPDGLRADVPTPDFVKRAGRGDVYDSSIWIGRAPTFTPLHKDPNPNLFVQLCGTKIVRLVHPMQGEGLLYEARKRASQTGGSSAIRGEEMMAGPEREALEHFIWDSPSGGMTMYEAMLEAGDGLFIPKGWWHSIKSVGAGIVGSVNWWFR